MARESSSETDNRFIQPGYHSQKPIILGLDDRLESPETTTLRYETPADPDFERAGDDLKAKVKIDLYTAVLGGDVQVNTLNGSVNLKVKPGTQNGTTVRLKGKGFPVYKKEGQSGDLFVTYEVKLPTDLTDKQKELFEQLKNS